MDGEKGRLGERKTRGLGDLETGGMDDGVWGRMGFVLLILLLAVVFLLDLLFGSVRISLFQTVSALFQSLRRPRTDPGATGGHQAFRKQTHARLERTHQRRLCRSNQGDG